MKARIGRIGPPGKPRAMLLLSGLESPDAPSGTIPAAVQERVAGHAARNRQSWTFSVYAVRFHGRTAADGSIYDHGKLTCASNNHALGTRLHIAANERCVMVTVTDRLDRRLGQTRIDLSGAAMKALDPSYDGTDETAGLLHGTATEVDRKESN